MSTSDFKTAYKTQISVVQAGSAVTDLDCVEFRLMSDFFFVCLSDAFDECIYRIIFYNADCASAESAAGNAGPDHARDFPCQINQNINFITGNCIVVPQRYMGLIHQFSEPADIACAKSSDSVDGALIFVNCMFRSFQLCRICDQAFVCFKVLRTQIAKRFNVEFFLQSSESICTLLTSCRCMQNQPDCVLPCCL